MPGRTGADGNTIVVPRAKQMFQIDASEISLDVVWKTAFVVPGQLRLAAVV